MNEKLSAILKEVDDLTLEDFAELCGWVDIKRGLRIAGLSHAHDSQEREDTGKNYMTAKQIAKELCVTEQKAREIMKEIPHLVTGKYVRVRRSKFDAWAQEHTESPVDSSLGQRYSDRRERKRTAADSKGVRLLSGGVRRFDRDDRKQRRSLGAERTGDLRTGRTVPEALSEASGRRED